MTDIVTDLASKRRPGVLAKPNANTTDEVNKPPTGPAAASSSANEGDNKKTPIGHRKSRYKLVIRLLPPEMTEHDFLGLVSPWINYRTCDYYYYVKGRVSSKSAKLPTPSRAYAGFNSLEPLREFYRQFKRSIILQIDYQSGWGAGASTMTPIVEYAPCQGKLREFDAPNSSGTIESDPFYKKFIESLSDPKIELPSLVPPPPPKAGKKGKEEPNISNNNKPKSKNKAKPKNNDNKKEDAAASQTQQQPPTGPRSNKPNNKKKRDSDKPKSAETKSAGDGDKHQISKRPPSKGKKSSDQQNSSQGKQQQQPKAAADPDTTSKPKASAAADGDTTSKPKATKRRSRPRKPAASENNSESNKNNGKKPSPPNKTPSDKSTAS